MMVYLGITNSRGIKEGQNGVLEHNFTPGFNTCELTHLLQLEREQITGLYGIVNGTVERNGNGLMGFNRKELVIGLKLRWNHCWLGRKKKISLGFRNTHHTHYH
jgi:hypothetical protein